MCVCVCLCVNQAVCVSELHLRSANGVFDNFRGILHYCVSAE